MSIPVYMPMCIDCIHLEIGKKINGRTPCKAYPEGIPYEIWKEKAKPSADKTALCPNGYKFEHLKNNTQTAD